MATGERKSDGADRNHHPRGKRPVISSLTGKPIDWDADDGDDETPALPDGTGDRDSNDARLLGDVPPHWGGSHDEQR